ncbi:MAG: hypothetical protein HC890_10785 [Chloroflexaceae bacterium]|nr:hypothetical protein [Chloroflexaceae bacterium]
MERNDARKSTINCEQEPRQPFELSLSTTAWEILNQQARSQGISPSVLIEQWAHQRQDTSGSRPEPGTKVSAGFGCQQAEAARTRANQELAAGNAELLQLNEELQITLEELAVAEEELRVQNQQLEIERQRYQDLFNFAPMVIW